MNLNYLRESLKKEWKKRVVLWTFCLLIVVTLYKAQISGAIYLFLLILFILLDELIKEGYLFKTEDLVKGITHEFIIIIVIMITIVKIAITKIRREKR